MRVFMYEHLCTLPDLGSSLRAEGRAMLSAALADLCALEEVDVVTLAEPSLFPALKTISPRLKVRAVSSVTVEAAFRSAASGCDFALVIAPEFDDILATRAEWAQAAGCKLLGPSPEAIRVCADKLRLAEYLREQDISTPATSLYDPRNPPIDGYPYVVKPRSGAGAQATFRVGSAAEYLAAGDAARVQGFGGELIVQPFCRGRPASVAVIVTTDTPIFLAPADQFIETVAPGGQMRYAGGAVRYPVEFRYPSMLAQAVAWGVPGCAGYLGIDVMVGNGCECHVIEVNPRLTTSYVGLRRLCTVNLMQTLLDGATGKKTAWPNWREGRVRFDPDGTVYEEPSPPHPQPLSPEAGERGGE